MKLLVLMRSMLPFHAGVVDVIHQIVFILLLCVIEVVE